LNNNLLFIAPSNSVHSFKWINFFYTNTKFQITWISFYKKTITQEIPDKINYFELTGSNPLKIFFKLKDIYFKKDFFCTHLHYIGRYSYLLLFLNIKNLIISPWGSDIKLIDKNIFKKIIVKTLLESSKLLTVDANFMKDLVLQLVKKPLKIKRINFGTDTDIFDFNNKNSPIENIKIISLRSLEKLYSIDTLIKAAKILKQKKIKFEIDIYGKGSEKESLIKLINKLQLEGFVNLKGAYNYTNLPKILKKYNLYVSTSKSDAGLAASTSEAMSSGLFIITADNSENPYWTSNDSGILFKTESSIDLADKIIRFSKLNDEEKNRYRINARNKILKYNSFENEMRKMLTHYQKLNNEKN
jgi:glycosyltransferase involved in cell wall biosynthesis